MPQRLSHVKRKTYNPNVLLHYRIQHSLKKIGNRSLLGKCLVEDKCFIWALLRPGFGQIFGDLTLLLRPFFLQFELVSKIISIKTRRLPCYVVCILTIVELSDQLIRYTIKVVNRKIILLNICWKVWLESLGVSEFFFAMGFFWIMRKHRDCIHMYFRIFANF